MASGCATAATRIMPATAAATAAAVTAATTEEWDGRARRPSRSALLPRLAALACALACAALPMQAAAQSYPSKAVRLIVTFPPGGSSDMAARIIAPKLAERLGQAVVIENRPGAGGGIGVDLAAKAAPDGHTIVMAPAGALTANINLYKNLPYDPVKDLAPVILVGTSPFVLAANAALPASSIREVVALARAKPGELTYASGGNGTAMHLSGELLKSMSGTNIVHVPYKGTVPAVMAVIAGDTQLAIADVTAILPHVKSGRLKVLGLLSRERSTLAPDIPTLAETGLPGYDANGWFALMAPAATPPAIVARLNTEVAAVLQLPEVREQFLRAALEAKPGTPQDLAQLIAAETVKWAKVIREAGVKID